MLRPPLTCSATTPDSALRRRHRQHLRPRRHPWPWSQTVVRNGGGGWGRRGRGGADLAVVLVGVGIGGSRVLITQRTSPAADSLGQSGLQTRARVGRFPVYHSQRCPEWRAASKPSPNRIPCLFDQSRCRADSLQSRGGLPAIRL